MRFCLPTIVLAATVLCASAAAKSPRAKNVILFLADAGGVPTVSAASIHGYGEARQLYIQSWPHMGLSDTSTAGNWVSDSAAGMTAIVTGRKTQNGVISMGPDTVRGKKDGAILKTLLEYAEEKGLSTGVVSNVNIADATPAACYAHANDRALIGEIFLQAFSPRFGDGVDVVLGAGRPRIYKAVQAIGKDLDAVAKEKGRVVRSDISAVTGDDARPIVVTDTEPDVPSMTKLALNRLSRNKKGYFLMVEWDTHTDNPLKGLNNLVAFDKLIREISSQVNLKDTLLVFTADHSFGLSVRGGKRGEPLLRGLDEWTKENAGKKSTVMELPNVRVHNNHTGEEVIVAAQGPGAERIQGFMPNTRMFEVILAAWGWQETKQ